MNKIDLLQRHRKTCAICGSTPIDRFREFCPIGRMLAADVLYPIHVLPAGPVRRWWRFWNWLGRGLGRVIA